MGIPRIMKLCGKDVKVIYVKNLTDDNGQPLLGLADVNKSAIYLRRGMEVQTRLEVLLHESLHFIDESLLFGMGEKKVNNWAVEIIRLFKDNKIKIS